MIAFPLDNVEYEAGALGAWCGTRTRGVFASDGHYAVTANGDMSVTVNAGLAWLKADTYWGVNMFERNSTVLTLDTADGILARWAAVCLQLDKNANVGAIVLKYGAYGTNPALSSLPAPVQDSLDYDEIYVAAIQIRAGVTAILTSDITDLRLDETYCGIMRDGVTGIPTQQLAAQWTDWMANFTAEAQAYYGTYQNMVLDSYAAFVSTIAVHEASMDAYETTAQNEFEAWLATVQATLDGDTAGNILNLIDALTASVALKAPINHKSANTDYGVADETNYGHLKADADATDSFSVQRSYLTSITVDLANYTNNSAKAGVYEFDGVTAFQNAPPDEFIPNPASGYITVHKNTARTVTLGVELHIHGYSTIWLWSGGVWLNPNVKSKTSTTTFEIIQRGLI